MEMSRNYIEMQLTPGFDEDVSEGRYIVFIFRVDSFVRM